MTNEPKIMYWLFKTTETASPQMSDFFGAYATAEDAERAAATPRIADWAMWTLLEVVESTPARMQTRHDGIWCEWRRAPIGIRARAVNATLDWAYERNTNARVDMDAAVSKLHQHTDDEIADYYANARITAEITREAIAAANYKNDPKTMLRLNDRLESALYVGD